jgi:ribosomal-protein-alanine N-acetyltransferase
MNAPVITLAGRGSASIFAALHALCFPAEAWDATAMSDLLTTPGTLGFLIRGPADEPDGLALVRMALDEAEILTFGLRPEARGRGRAARLLEGVIGTLEERGIRSLYLEVAVDNLPARKLYGARGFFEIGRRVGYYDRGHGARVDALRLRLAIGGGPGHHERGGQHRKVGHGPKQ